MKLKHFGIRYTLNKIKTYMSLKELIRQISEYEDIPVIGTYKESHNYNNLFRDTFLKYKTHVLLYDYDDNLNIIIEYVNDKDLQNLLYEIEIRDNYFNIRGEHHPNRFNSFINFIKEMSDSSESINIYTQSNINIDDFEDSKLLDYIKKLTDLGYDIYTLTTVDKVYNEELDICKLNRLYKSKSILNRLEKGKPKKKFIKPPPIRRRGSTNERAASSDSVERLLSRHLNAMTREELESQGVNIGVNSNNMQDTVYFTTTSTSGINPIAEEEPNEFPDEESDENEETSRD